MRYTKPTKFTWAIFNTMQYTIVYTLLQISSIYYIFKPHFSALWHASCHIHSTLQKYSNTCIDFHSPNLSQFLISQLMSMSLDLLKESPKKVLHCIHPIHLVVPFSYTSVLMWSEEELAGGQSLLTALICRHRSNFSKWWKTTSHSYLHWIW